ncbi:hypothetical protein ACSSS7_004695 [Eimeria intestinalis]
MSSVTAAYTPQLRCLISRLQCLTISPAAGDPLTAPAAAVATAPVAPAALLHGCSFDPAGGLGPAAAAAAAATAAAAMTCSSSSTSDAKEQQLQATRS